MALLRRREVLIAMAALAIPAAAFTQSYPSKPIRFILPDGPGGPNDLRARQLAPKLSEYLGQPVVIDNRPGASYIVGAQAAAKALPDGYTIFMGSTLTHSLNPLLFNSLPYRPNEDFVPVTMVTAGPLMVAINADVPATNLQELIELSKARPNQISYGVPGVGSPGHLVMEQLKRETGAQFVMVPYKSTGGFIQDLIGGHLAVTFNYWSTLGPHVRAGKIRALAVAAPRRLQVAPDIPTFAEAGVPGIECLAWQGVFVPAGTPRSVVYRLHSEIVRALNAPEIRANLIETGAEVGGNSPEEFAAMIRADQEKWRRLAAAVELARQ
jgi:tripartite-type tricarboxylate transporter receptor subunit TctC